ncbi:MAG: helix-turn-helix transcriptional regulator, partial [Clostridia bacterium]|nr:helix-turn-helix transcriptional regulator [Clostridia bacterium]
YYASFQLPLDQRFGKAFLSPNEYNTLSLLIANLKQECNSTEPGHTDRQLLLLMLILSYTQSSLLRVDSSDEMATNIPRLITYLQHHYADDHSLDELCKIALCGKRHLTRQFKKITNETVTEFITRLRINNACIMLANTDLNITSIATKVGYRNSSFFGKVFKEQTGLSPKEYRKQLTPAKQTSSSH